MPCYSHPGIKDKSCDDCHNKEAGNAPMDKQPDLCYACHEDFSEQFKYVHGPVAGGFCTECHNIHNSKNEKLIVRTGREMCLYCHESSDVFKNEVHEDIEDTSCFECHNAHGANCKYLLE
ncbi:MAG: hypothetical protein KAR38_08000 [Calditrichia bacterium]|nr:hypothetical protein [Calditrichia bacterium]